MPDSNRIGDEGMGFIAMMQRLPQERVGAACANVAHAKQILLETIEYAKERKAFGQSIGSFQHNKFKIAELVTAIEVAEAYVDDCIEAHAEGRCPRSTRPRPSGGAPRCRTTCSTSASSCTAATAS